MLIWWVRHGQNVANVTGTLSHRVFDGDLTELGREQAHGLGEQLRDYVTGRGTVGIAPASMAAVSTGLPPVDMQLGTESPPAHRPVVLVCSPLRRARQTAEILSPYLGLAVSAELEDLREVNVGQLDGRSDAKSVRQYEAVIEAWRAGRAGERFPGGEDRAELSSRLARGLSEVCGLGGRGPAVVVAHGANIRAALPDLAGVDDPGFDLPTGSCAEFDATLDGGRLRLTVRAWPLDLA